MDTVEKNRGWSAWGKSFSVWDACWLFAIGSLIGFFLEGIWGMMRGGPWVSHATLVWGPFCPVYGLGAVAIYIAAGVMKGKPLLLRFFVYALAGGAVEFLVSLLQEVFLRAETWNYSEHFLNIDGRVSLKMTLLWGALGIAFSACFFPWLSRVFEKTHGRTSRVLCLLVCGFLAINFLMSGLTLNRWRNRRAEIPASNALEEYLDERYGNERMERIFTNLRFLE